MKVWSCGFSIAFILIAVLGSMGITDVNESNIEEYIQSDCESVADFIEDNFEQFVNEYNEAADDSWEASSIEDKFPITVDECGTTFEGVFMDFDGDNGYTVIGNNYELLDFATSGASPYAGIESTKYFYSATTGYYYLSGNDYLSVNAENNADESFLYDNINTKHYDGQEYNASGCGKIEDTDKYVASKYGSGWTLGKRNRLPMTGYTQENLSCIQENAILNNRVIHYSEGNCWVVSAYTVLQYMSDNLWKYSGMPKSSSTVVYDPAVSEPNLYHKYYNADGKNIAKKIYYNNGSSSVPQYSLRQSTFKFPKLYAEVRKHVNSKYKQINEGGSIYDTSEIVEYIARQYNKSVNAKEHYFWGLYADKGTQQIENGIPLLWATSGDTYGSHTMAVCGYKYYSKTTGWWIFKTTQYKLFYELRDGHTSSARYFDMSGHAGFSTIISLEF